MSESIIIAETGKGTVSAVTAELVSAAIALGTSPTVVVPCTDASMADNAGYDGVARTIAVKGACFENYDAASWATAIDAASPSGIIITAATPQSKDIAARIAAKRARDAQASDTTRRATNFGGPKWRRIYGRFGIAGRSEEDARELENLLWAKTLT